MRIHEIMTEPVETVGIDADARDAIDRMHREKIHHLIVLDGKKIVGVVSSEELQGREGRVGDRMTPIDVSADPEMYVKDAANLMRGRALGCLPVVDEGMLVGIVTISDLLEVIGRSSEKPVEVGKRWTLRHRGPRHQHHH